MEEFYRASGGNLRLRIKDFHWGKTEGPFRIGIWAARQTAEPGKRLALRAAVHNVSNDPIGIGHGFGLVVKHDGEVHESFGGPRSSGPILLEPGEFKELLGWSLDEESGLQVGINECWVAFRGEVEELRSAVIEIEMRPCTL